MHIGEQLSRVALHGRTARLYLIHNICMIKGLFRASETVGSSPNLVHIISWL